MEADRDRVLEVKPLLFLYDDDYNNEDDDGDNDDHGDNDDELSSIVHHCLLRRRDRDGWTEGKLGCQMAENR